MMMTLSGTFFVLPLYLQIVLGKDPLETGLRVLPLSLGVFVVSLVGLADVRRGSRPGRWSAPGWLTVLVGVLLLLATIEPTLNAAEFLAAMAIVGAGLGMIGRRSATSTSRRWSRRRRARPAAFREPGRTSASRSARR